MFCSHCGTAIEPGFKFCKHCGAAIDGYEPTSQGRDAGHPAPAAAIPPKQSLDGAPGAVAQPMVAAAPPPPPPPLAAALPQTVAQPLYYVTYQAAALAHGVQQRHLLESLRGRLDSLASTERLEGFSLKAMFSEVFKRRGADAVEDYLLVGTAKTTPPLELVETGWPKPWLFFRVLAALVVTYVALTFLYMQTGNTNCVPGMMFLGAFAVPLATLTLFFELNTPRNVSMHAVVKLFLYGAVASLAVALLGYALPVFQVSDMEAGIVEEIAKLLTVVVVMRSARYPYILNGILFGATVGAGFACFETAGYALNVGLLPGLLPWVHLGDTQVGAAAMHHGVVSMLEVLRLRGVQAPLGHVAWTALAAGAFWRVKGGRRASVSMLFDARFLKTFLIPMTMHAIWDAPWQLPFAGNQIITGLVSWYVVFGLVQQGLRQVQAQQKAQLQSTLASVEAAAAAPVAAAGTAMA